MLNKLVTLLYNPTQRTKSIWGRDQKRWSFSEKNTPNGYPLPIEQSRTYIQAAFYYTMDWLYLGIYVYVYMHTVTISKDYAISQK